MPETFDFDQVIDRRHTNALAMDGYLDYLFKNSSDLALPTDGRELIPMWVADMAFASTPAAIDAIRERLEHPVLGYTMNFDDEYHHAFTRWTQHHFDWACSLDALCISGGIVPALYDLTEQLCAPDEHILTLTPAYGYFQHAADHHRRQLEPVPLTIDDGAFAIDFDALTRAAAHPRARVLYLCHPHNPTGRIWCETDLRRLAQTCIEHDVVIVSDEIHCDLRRRGRSHTPLAKLMPDCDDIITCMSPSKTFNLAGLLLGNVIIENKTLRRMWQERVNPMCNPLSLAAAQGAYTHGHAWLAALLDYLDGNFELLEQRLRADLPDARFSIPDATYMAWVNFEAYFPPDTNLTRFFVENAGVIVEGGEMFVAGRGRHVRLNLACPRATLSTALDRIVEAISARANRY